jgi:xanthine/uracil permease
MAATRVYSTLAYWVAAAAALLLSTVPKFGAVVATVPAGVIGGLSTLLFGLIAVLGARIWVQNKVDFSKPVNLATAGVALIMGAANYTIVGQDMVFEGIAMGTAAALIIFHGMNGLEKLRDKLSASTTA